MTTDVIGYASERTRAPSVSAIGPYMGELLIAGFAICALLIAQLMLMIHVHGSNYAGDDGALSQATLLAALKFNNLFAVTNISPVQGVGSQIPTMNVWANPAFWPFAFLSRETATEISALVALGIFVSACYIMMRCFDVPAVPSAVAAQSSILLFSPALVLASMPTNFFFCAGMAVVYAPYFIALGLLSRLEPGSWRLFGLITAGIFVSLFYSIYCDPMWTMVNAVSWTVPFAVVALGSRNWRTILVRCAALACCLGVLLLSGAIGYLYTLSQYTARVQFAEALDRVRGPGLVSALAFSYYVKTLYFACLLGWLLGLLTLRGRARLLAIAAAVSGAAYAAYSVVYLLLNAPWILPIPLYAEHSLFMLFLAGAVAGYWGVVRAAALSSLRLAALASQRVWLLVGATQRPSGSRLIGTTLGLLVAAVVPALAANFAINRPNPFADNPNFGAWSNDFELKTFLADNVSRAVDKPLRGAASFWTAGLETHYTMADLWAHGIPTINEYSQLVTPQALYFLYQVFKHDVLGNLNWFRPFFRDGYSSQYWKAMQMFGVRYSVGFAPMPDQYLESFSLVTLPHRPVDKAPGLWYIYQLPRPNVGDYSPTEVVLAQSAADMAAVMVEPNFDFTRQAVLSTPVKETLVPARDMRLSLTRGGGLHVSGRSDGTSLVVLPYQFSHCLRAGDGRARLVRTNLMMTGMIFSGDLDTGIVFDYGLFSPGCRRADLADMKRLEVKIDFRMPHLSGDRLFPDRDEAQPRLRAAATAMSLDNPTFNLPFVNSYFTLPFMH
jgi:hypothetical protein